MPNQPALFLDRDGVIIENRANYVRSWADVEIYPQALEALASIRHTPFKIIIVTNQSAVGRGIITLETAWAIQERLVEVIEAHNGRIDDSFICPHAPDDNCDCRKPKPGMLFQAAAKHHINLSQSYMIGDAVTDLKAGLAAGVKEGFILRTGRGLSQLNKLSSTNISNLAIHDNLSAAIHALAPILILPPPT